MWEGKYHTAGYPHKNPPLATENSEKKGDLLIHNLWKREMDGIHDMLVGNTNNLFHRKKSPEKCLQTVDRENKKKYL